MKIRRAHYGFEDADIVGKKGHSVGNGLKVFCHDLFLGSSLVFRGIMLVE
jgi:hypothetical protein